MLKDILKQFELLSSDKKRFLSSPVILSAVEGIEKKHGVKLALVLIEIAVDKEKFDNLTSFLKERLGIEESIAFQINEELKKEIFNEFLNIKKEKKDLSETTPSQQVQKIVAPNFKVDVPKEPVKNDKINKKEAVIPETSPKNLPVVTRSIKKEESKKEKQPFVSPDKIVTEAEKIPETSFIKQEDDLVDDNELIFNKSDEEELKIFKDKTKDLKSSVWQKIDWDKEAKNTIFDLDIDIGSDLLKNRFKNILISSLKGIRNFIDLRDVLRKRVEEGGMGFVSEVADKTVKAVKTRKLSKQEDFSSGQEGAGKLPEKSEINVKLKADNEPLAEKQLPVSPSIEIDEIEASNKKIEKEKISIEKKGSEGLNKVSSAFGLPQVKSSSKDNQKAKPPQSMAEFIPEADAKNLINNQQETTEKEKARIPEKKSKNLFGFKRKKQERNNITAKPQKVKMEDIKQVNIKEEPKLIGSIEEIEGLSINDFRYWSDDPYKSAEKIKEKINILAEESLEKGVLGIKAWKKSEINKLYLNILNSAMISHTPVPRIIEKLEEERKITLTEKEFEAIAELNQNLRF